MLALIVGPCDANKIAEGIAEGLKKDTLTLGFEVSASIGIHTTKFDSELDLNKAINYADEQMYQMKKQSK